jgi:excisionase family DNA binding protein
MSDKLLLLTIPEFASALRIKPSCVRRWMRESKITFVHVGRLVRIPGDEVARIISQGTRPARPQRHSRETPRRADY